MACLSFHGGEVELNHKGFLENYDDWDDEVCEALAASEGFELDELRWCVIHFLREFYEDMGVPASPHVLISKIGEQLAHFKCTHRNINLLFPVGGCRQAARLAGLPEYFTHGC